ncbi:MAG: AAA family ATPase [Planctomycetota bacterium]
MEVVVLVGIQGSGKSTFFKERLFDTHVRINLDMLRTRAREKRLVEACIAAQQRFVVDNTNPTRADRERYLPKAKAAGFRAVAYWFDVSVEGCKRRNAARRGRKAVPAVAIMRTRAKLEPPSLDEGFDEVHRVTLAADGSFAVD